MILTINSTFKMSKYSQLSFLPEEIVARMNNSNVNEFGRDVDKGDVTFLAACQCFRSNVQMF